MIRFLINLLGGGQKPSRKVFRSDDGRYYVVFVGTMHTPSGPLKMARLFDLKTEIIGPEEPAVSIARLTPEVGYTPYDGKLPRQIQRVVDGGLDQGGRQ